MLVFPALAFSEGTVHLWTMVSIVVMGAAFGPVTILALYWRRFNFWGALAAITAGTTTVSIWQFNSGGPCGMFDMAIAAAPGFIAAIPAAIIVTVLTSPPSTEVMGQFDRVNARALAVP